MGAQIWLSELIWRDFYQMVCATHPNCDQHAIKPIYDTIQWQGEEEWFTAWCNGQTGFPIVDAAMRQLNQTGFMHNRCRMITASFLCKTLLIDWRKGESYFAKQLLDFDFASNNGGGSGRLHLGVMRNLTFEFLIHIPNQKNLMLLVIIFASIALN